jgi:hypothetical protein
MPADLLKLDALTRTAIRTATDAYLAGGSIDVWQREMQRAITRGHTASTLAGIAERLNIPIDKDLISEKRLSRAERNEIKQAVARQLEYLRGFVADVQAGKLSEKQIRARADLYSGATRTTYFESRWGNWQIPPELLPGMQTCTTNCKCSISVKDNNDGTGTLTRVLGAVEVGHCTACPPLAGDHQVRRRSVS